MTLIVAWLRPGCALILLAFTALACHSTLQPTTSVSRYLVTESPIHVGEGIGLCLAVDPTDRQGIWWWMPGESGCTTRSSGPGVIHAEGAQVSPPAPAAATALSFRLGTHSATRPFIDVRLTVEDGRMRAVETAAQVSLQDRENLDIPEQHPRGGD